MSNIDFRSTHAGHIADLGLSSQSRAKSRFDYMHPEWRESGQNIEPLNDNVLWALSATMDEGMFGRQEPERRKEQSATMDEGTLSVDETGRRQASKLFAGYTYLGQFIDHDLTLDRSIFEQTAQPPTKNLRTPRFDLDSLYDVARDKLRDKDGVHLRLSSSGWDLPREGAKAVIGDGRNDANLIISQLHVAFAKFHNRIADDLCTGSKSGDELFSRVRKTVMQHFQWIVLDDYLPTIVGQKMVDSILPPSRIKGLIEGSEQAPYENLKLFNPTSPNSRPFPFMPLEFSGAAFRFGHSMVRSDYQLNRESGPRFLFDAAEPAARQANDLRGFRPLPKDMLIDWSLFFPFNREDTSAVQLARPIDPLIAQPMFSLPFKVAQVKEGSDPRARILPYRNLHRGETVLKLPSGQQVVSGIKDLGVEIRDVEIVGGKGELRIQPGGGLDPNNIGGTRISLTDLERTVARRTPLWYYVLKEAQEFHAGEQLGKVGGRIVAEVLIGLMLADEDSILGQKNGHWRPVQGEFGCTTDGSYKMVDLLRYAQVRS